MTTLSPANIHQTAAGALAAQRVRDQIRAGRVGPDTAWLRLVELAATYGWKSPAAASFVAELAKETAHA